MNKLNELLKVIDVIECINTGAETINGIAYHSGKVKDGDLFFCLKGYLVDGHKYLKSAVENGAVAAIVEDFQEEINITQYKVNNARAAMAKIADAYYDNPSKKLNAVAITGTNGKTTTSFMVNSIFEEYNLKTGLIGTVVIKIGEKSEAAVLTTPESIDLQKYYKEMVDANCTHVTMEVSSSALELSRTEASDFDIVALNNVSREHIDSHGSFDKYFGFKSSLITNVKEEAWAVLNLDCEYSSALINRTKANVFTYGIEDRSGNLSIKDLDLSTGRGTFTVEILKSIKTDKYEYEKQSFKVSLSVPGYHSVYNSLSAISIALLSGIPIEDIIKGLKTFKGVERRFEFIHEGDFIIVDDHFANTGNIKVTLETMKFMHYNKLIMVYAIRGSRGPTVNRENAEEIVKWAAKLGITEIIATYSRSHVNKYNFVTDEEIQVFDEVMSEANINIKYYEELPDAIEDGISKVKKNDVLLLAGCQGMDFGGHIALKILNKLYPEIDKEKLFAPIKYRVCGILED